MSNTVPGPDGHPRCAWCGTVDAFFPYHDTEWGYPVDDDQRLFEKLCLESFQSGLSWRTILDKRDNFRQAFAQFDFHKVALYKEKDVKALLENAGIVRHRGKISAVINNAARAVELEQEAGSLAHFFWQFEPEAASLPEPQSRTTCPESEQLAKALKQRGWKFVGPTTAYAFMQAMGLINDHVHECSVRANVEAARAKFRRP